jgi:Mrp family chromosome partitioning ATPase
LAGSDPSVIAAQTDGVVLTLRLTRDSRQRAKQAMAILDRIDASMLGVVVNRMRGAILKQQQMERRDYALTPDDVDPSSRAELGITVG